MNNNDFYNSLFEGFDEALLNNFANITKNLLGSPTVIQKSFSPNNFLKTYLSLATNLNDKSIDVLMFLLNNSNEEGVYVGTYDTIINDLQISRNTLANIMTELQSKNLVSKVKDGWQVSSSVNIPANGQNIVIQFNKTPAKQTERTKPQFDFENFEHFIPEYLSSFNRVIPEDAKTFNNEDIQKDIQLLKEEYTNSDTTFPINQYIKDIDTDKYKCKNELSKMINTYSSSSKKLKFLADPEDISLEKTRANYLELFANVSELSTDSQILVKSALIQILDIAEMLKIRDFQMIETLITNKNGIGTNLVLKAEASLKAKGIRENKYLSAMRYYLQRYENSLAFEYLNALIVLIKDEYTIIRY